MIANALDDLDGRIGEGWGGLSPNGTHVNVVLARRGSPTAAAALSMFAHPSPGHTPVLCCVGPSQQEYEPIWPPTLMMNKEYLGTPRYAWDPIVFGLMLMGSAIALKRWLASGENGDRAGFTATRILASDKAKAGVLGTVASLAHPGTPAAEPASAPADPIGGGGRSGGAGASGSF